MIDADQNVRTLALRRDLGRRCALRNLDELRIIDRVLQRLELGSETYGPLNLSVPRNWRKERFDERLDALVYDVAEELAAEDVAHAELQEAARRELAEWDADQLTRVSDEPARIAFGDIVEREPYVDFKFDDSEGG